VQAPAPKKGGDDGDESEEEDPLGDQEWAKTNEADFSAGVDDLFADLLSMKDDFDNNTPDELKNAKMFKLGEDSTAAEAEEKSAAEQDAAKAAAEEEEAEKRRIGAEKRKNMTKEAKMAKMNCRNLEKKAEGAKEDGKLASEEAFAKAQRCEEDEEWEAAEVRPPPESGCLGGV
jgi:hypothetical protein